VTALSGSMTNSSVVLTGGNVIIVEAVFNYTAQTGAATFPVGTASIMFVTYQTNFTVADFVQNATNATISTLWNASVVMDGKYPTDAYSLDLVKQMAGNITVNYPTMNNDLQVAVNSYYAKVIWPASITVNTMFPDMNFNLNISWTGAPLYNNTASLSNSSVIYSMDGTVTTAAQKVTVKVEKKTKQFLKMLEEVEATSSPVPTFDPTLGSRQVIDSTKSLVYDIVQSLVKSGNWNWAVTNANKQSTLFSVSMAHLGSIYPGVLYTYPRDAAVTVTATVLSVNFPTWHSGRTATVQFNFADSQGVSLLTTKALLSFVPYVQVAGNTLNFGLGGISFVTNTITNAPYGFVDASTLESWIDDAFTNFNVFNWNLYKFPLDYTSVVGTVASITVADDTILVAGN